MTSLGGKSSLLRRLLALAAAAALPATFALLFLIGSAHSQREDATRAEALRLGEIASREMDRIIDGTRSVLLAMAAAPELERPEGTGCALFMSRVSIGLPQLRGFVLRDSDGAVRCASGGTDPGSADESMPVAPGTLWTGFFVRPRPEGAPLLPLTLGLDLGATLTTWLDLDWLQDRVRERNLTRGGALTVADRDGVILAREPYPERLVGTRIPDDFQYFVQASEAGTMEVQSQDGTRRIIGYHPPQASGTGLYVSVGVSTEEAFAPIWRSTWQSLGLAGAGLAGTFLMAWAVGDRIIRQPIRRLLETVGAWRAGDLDARTGMPHDDGEITQLAAAIDGYMDEVSEDRAARIRAERHREVLLSEMQHRIKNTLGTVQAIARQTFAGKVDPEAARVFGERLGSMAEAHAILLSDSWESADLRELLETAIRPFDGDASRRVRFGGPDLRIESRGALALAMAVHELCTNATKYGALSVPGGIVDIAWRIDAGRFRLTWTERGGPVVASPERNGFGSRMIERVLAVELGAEAKLSYPAEGVVFTLDGDASKDLATPGECSSAA